MKHFALLLVLISVLTTGCNTDDNNEPNQPNGVVLKDAAVKVIEASNNFTFDIFNELEKEYSDENIFFSPLSMSMALSMAMNGAVDETKDQIKDVIDFGAYTDDEINLAFKDLQSAFSTLDSEVEFSLANSAWYRDDLSLLANYQDILIDYYYAEIAGLNFSDAQSVSTINNWIADKTNDKIKDMISQLDPATVLVLVNAIYFKGTWTYEFDSDNTYNGVFKGLNNERINCEIMESGKIKTKFVVDTTKSIVSLPYGNGAYEMVLYMPANNTNMNNVLSELDASALNTLLENSTTDSIIVHLPKFKIETPTFSIVKMLKSLGMVLPFTANADFSNIFGVDLSIFISDVLHKAFIEVNEEGTEAAAATVIVFENTSIGEEERVFYFNKPFLFFIREVSTGEILFAGKLVNPGTE